MPLKGKILLLILGLAIPYMALAMYVVVWKLPTQPVPMWFLCFAPCYFLATVLLGAVLVKRIKRNAPPQGSERQKTDSISAGRAVRRLGYIWLLGPVFYLLSGGLSKEPVWISVLGFAWAGFLSWATFRAAKKIELKARQS
jgi:hypothetical protein